MDAAVGEWCDKLLAWGPGWVYAAIFLACFVENLFPPFPGDSFILISGALIHYHRLSLVPAMLSAIGGGLISVFLLYLIGRRWGSILVSSGRVPFTSTEDVTRAESLYARWGSWLVIGSRFFFGIRSLLNLVAGMAKYPLARFLSLSAISYLLFVSLLILAGGLASDSIESLSRLTGSIQSAVSIVLLVLVGVWITVRILRSRSQKR